MQRNKQSQKRLTFSFHGSQITHFPRKAAKKSENHDLKPNQRNERKPNIPGIDTKAQAFHHTLSLQTMTYTERNLTFI